MCREAFRGDVLIFFFSGHGGVLWGTVTDDVVVMDSDQKKHNPGLAAVVRKAIDLDPLAMPWVCMVSKMLAQEPEITSSIDTICRILTASGSAALATSLCKHAQMQKLQVQEMLQDPRRVLLSTSRAFDVVAHTVSYAILDALRPEWAEGLSRGIPEGGVLHEAFADLTTILAQLASPAVCGSVVAQTRCGLRAADLVGRLQSTMANALGICALRSACSVLTALDVWDTDGRARETTRSSREVSAMITIF
eukprot:m51a1_g14333 hypothetical protein (250) ;mRNA; f:123575-128427